MQMQTASLNLINYAHNATDIKSLNELELYKLSTSGKYWNSVQKWKPTICTQTHPNDSRTWHSHALQSNSL